MANKFKVRKRTLPDTLAICDEDAQWWVNPEWLERINKPLVEATRKEIAGWLKSNHSHDAEIFGNRVITLMWFLERGEMPKEE